MQAFYTSIPLVAIAEIGDKTQLLSLMLAARYRVIWPIIGGILIATLINHGLSAWAGEAFSHILNGEFLSLVTSCLFLVLGVWILIPDKIGDAPHYLDRYGPFLATLIAFFLAEIGDKTQMATIALAAQYQSILWVMLGTTLGMLVANIPVIFLGEKLLRRIPFSYVRTAASSAFLACAALGFLRYFEF